MLATVIDDKDEWEECLPKVYQVYNTSEQAAMCCAAQEASSQHP